MKHGQQSDGHSCGICTSNMIAYRVQYDPLWSVSEAPYQRAMWFNRMVVEHTSSVGASITSKCETDPI
jgi:hypothetical protein